MEHEEPDGLYIIYNNIIYPWCKMALLIKNQIHFKGWELHAIKSLDPSHISKVSK